MVEHPNSTDSYSDFGVFEDRLPPFSFSDAWVVGWRALKRNYWLLVGATVGFIALTSAVNVVAGVLEGIAETMAEEAAPDRDHSEGLKALSGILQLANYLFVAPMVGAGFVYMGLLSVRWQAVSLGKLVFGFSRYWLLLRTVLLEWAIWVALGTFCGIGATLGYGIDYALENTGEVAFVEQGDSGVDGSMAQTDRGVVVEDDVQESHGESGHSTTVVTSEWTTVGEPENGPPKGMVIGLLVNLFIAFLAMLWIAPRLWFTYLLVVDPMSGVNTARDALRGSWNMTREHRWEVLGLVVMVVLVGNISMLLCCLPAFFLGMPLCACIQAGSYEMMRNSVAHSPVLDERDELPVPEEEE